MIKQLFTIVFALLFATNHLAAQGYTVETVPNVQLADARRFVSNPDGIISAAVEAEINRMCLDLRQRGLAEVVVLVLDRGDDGSLDMFAHNVLNDWGVGQRGKDNGLVISVVRSQRDIQFETGYGLEGVLPDALCKRIQTVYMAGPLRAGDFDKGLLDGVKAVYNVLTDNQAELTALQAADGSESSGELGILALMLLVFVAFIIVAAARRHKRGGGRGDGYDDGPGGSGGTGTGGLGGPGAGPIIGGLLGGGFGGGGVSFGGGFGGGRSGGGGARTGF